MFFSLSPNKLTSLCGTGNEATLFDNFCSKQPGFCSTCEKVVLLHQQGCLRQLVVGGLQKQLNCDRFAQLHALGYIVGNICPECFLELCIHLFESHLKSLGHIRGWCRGLG